MAKNRNKKKRNGVASMDFVADQTATVAQDMDTSESAFPKPSSAGVHTKVKGVQMKRSKNVRKKAAIAKAEAKIEQLKEKVLKNESKLHRIQSAKKLYD
nr:uncharacterized protein LOC109178168 [Ipomoea batatas]GMD58043.1 uncharacterized protein LOC109178168 [Ipomoea batatas]